MIDLVRDSVLHTKVFKDKVSSDDDLLAGDPCWIVQGVIAHSNDGSRRYTITVKNYDEDEANDPDLFIHVSSDRYGDFAEDILESVKNMLETLDSTSMEL
jgi:hypothetical protein